MAFDELLYLRDGVDSGDYCSVSQGESTIPIYIGETPVAGLGVNVVIPQVVTTGTDGLSIDLYESDTSAWDGTEALLKTLPTYLTADSYWDRFYSDKDWILGFITIVSASAENQNFGEVDIRLTDRFAKYAGQ